MLNFQRMSLLLRCAKQGSNININIFIYKIVEKGYYYQKIVISLFYDMVSNSYHKAEYLSKCVKECPHDTRLKLIRTQNFSTF